MKIHVFIYAPRARINITDTFDWYETKQAGLGLKFLDALSVCEDSIKKTPTGFQNRYKETREALITPFPYLMVYKVEKDVIYILRVFPTRSNPSKKYSRIAKRKK
jgi:plasmid stabilization system protein ParE